MSISNILKWLQTGSYAWDRNWNFKSLEILTLEQQGHSLVTIHSLCTLASCKLQKLQPHVLLEYISGSLEISSALRRITRARKAGWNDVDIFDIVQPVIEWRHRKWMWGGWFHGENVHKHGDHWIKGRKSPMGENSMLLSLFLRMLRSPLLAAVSQSVQNLIRVQPEIKMAEV